MEQPSLFKAAGVYAGNIELVANFQGVAKWHANTRKPRDDCGRSLLSTIALFVSDIDLMRSYRPLWEGLIPSLVHLPHHNSHYMWSVYTFTLYRSLSFADLGTWYLDGSAV